MGKEIVLEHPDGIVHELDLTGFAPLMNGLELPLEAQQHLPELRQVPADGLRPPHLADGGLPGHLGDEQDEKGGAQEQPDDRFRRGQLAHEDLLRASTGVRGAPRPF
jgi:hypothetical protein